MKKACIILLLLAAVSASICLMAGGAAAQHSTLDKIGKDLHIGVSRGTVLTEEDSHGGFHGDGISFVSVQFEDDSFRDIVAGQDSWKPLPADDPVQTLLYGSAGSGPYVTDGNGDRLFPLVQNGYYWLHDRQEGDRAEKSDILHRPSLNFTVVVYDADARTLYYSRMDT